MFSKKPYLFLVLFALFSRSLMGDTFGFEPDGSNYFKTVSEATDGTIQISVTDEGSAGFSLNFQLHVDYTTNVSTTNWKDNSAGNGYYRDWNPSGISWTSTNTATHPVTGGYLNASLNTSGSTPYWQINLVATSAGDMTYTITLPVFDDKIYEGGSTGTAETINFKISNVLSGTLDSDKNAFSYKIQDNDKIPYYGFAQTSTQTFDEGHNTDDDGDGLSFAIIPIANPTDNVVYAVGTNNFVINWAISDGTTTSSDYSSASGTINIFEQIGGGNDDESVINTSRYWQNRSVDITMVDDNVDEPDTETFTITLSTTDTDDGLIFGDNNDLSVVINDDPEDLAPYVRFTSASQYVDEESSNSTVTVSLELNAGSGFSDPSVAYTVSLSSTADPSGTYQDHTLENGTVVFDGAVGDQNQDITFTLKADVFDEGIDNDNSVVETIIIALDGGNVSNLRVDNDVYANTTHTVNIRDNDPTPQLAFSSDGSVTAVSGAESVTSPTIKVLVTDGAGNLTPSALPITLNVTNHTSSAGTATIYSDATTPWDYKINGTTGSVTGVTIPAYSSEYAVPIEINSDAYYEGSDETVKFDITAGNNVSGGTFTHTYTIGDDDAKPTIFFTNGASTITSTETGGSNITGTVDVQLSAVSAKAVDFTYSVTSYNAGSGDAAYLSNSIDDDGDGSTDESNEGNAANTDFDLPSTTGSIAAVTNTTATLSSTQISYTHYVDKVDELDKYVELTVAVAVGENDATVASNGTQTQIIKLEDDDAAQQVSFSASSDENNDEGDTETITVLKLTDSTTPAQTNGTTSSEFTMKATIGVGSSANPATDGDTDDDFDLSTSGGTAIAAGASQVLTFGPSDASASISIAVDDDDLFEGGASGTAEDVKFELSSLVNAVAGANPNMTYYIVDDENKPVISFDTDASNSVPSGNENTVSSPSITVIQDRRSIYPSTINYSADPSAGTASADDFTLEDGVAEIAALSTTTTIPLQIVSETKFEGNETVVIALDGSSVSGNTTPSGSNLSHTYTINNDDTKPTLEFSSVNKSGGSASASSPEEADGSVIITVSLSAITGVATNVSYTIASSTGASDADWSDGTTDYDSDASTNIITWAADESTISKTIVVNFTDDTIDEGDEIITVTLSGVTGGAQDGPTLLHTITLQDSDTPPIMQFTNNTASVNESDGTITIPLTLTHDGTNKQASDFGNAQMTWTINGLSTVTANNSSTDYPNDITTATTGSIVINKGLTDGSIVIPLNNDAIDEWDETLIVDLSSPVNATASGNQRITVTISDEDDASPTINFTSTALGSGTTETASANATINFTDHIRLTGKSGKDLWFSYTTEGGGAGTASPNQDYTPLTGTFKIVEDALAPSVTVPLVILADDVDELDEQTVKITISVLGADQNDDNSSYEETSSAETAKNGNMVLTYTIDDDDDPPNAFFKNVDGDNDSEVGSIDESAGPKEIIVALSAGSERNITLYYSDASSGSATSGSDYSAITAFTPITINGAVGGTGATESTISIAITNDEIHEEDQTIVLSLLSTNAATSDMATISYASAGGGSGEEAVNTYTLTIVNDEDPPKVNFTNGSAVTDAETTIDEDAGSVILNVELNRATEKTVTIPYTFSNDAVIPATGSTSTGAYPKDFYHTGFTDGGSLTISGDGIDVNQGATITINLLADAVDEWDEKVILNIGTPTNAEVGTVVTHTVIITDQSAAPTINFTTTAEGSGTSETASAAATINFTDHISLSSISGKDLWFSYATDGSPGTATSGQDYTPVSGSFKIAAGSTTPASSIALPILSDTVDELDEQTVKVTLDVLGADQNNDNSVYEATSNALSAIKGSMVYTYTIDDDDDPPFAYFKNLDSVTGSESGTVDEGETKTITVALSSPSERDIVIYRSDAGTGNATSGKDYTAITAFSKLTTISGTAGGIGADTEVTFDVISTEDLIHEVDQTIVINLLTTASVTGDMDVISYASAGGGTGAQAVIAYTLTIADDEELPAVNFTNGSTSALSTNTVSEDAGTITVNVELSIATEKTVTIPFTFGSSSLPAATGADATGAYPIDFYHSGYSGGGSLTINGDGTDVTPGASFVINIQSDAIDEWDEKIEINLGDGPTNAQKGGTFQHIITITDASEAPTINFSSTSLDNGNTETNQASTDFNLKDIIVLSSKSGKDITFSITTETDGNGATAAAPRDYTLINDTFTITAGNTGIAENLTLDILDDLYDETDQQTIVVDIAFAGADRDGDGSYDDPDGDPAAANGNTRFIYTINDDENEPTLVFADNYTLDEDVGNATTIKVKFDPSGTTLTERTVTGLISFKNTSTASNGSDLSTIADPTSLIISDGINGTIFPGITIIDDDRWEDAETIVLELTVDAGGAGNARIDTDNDETVITISDDPADEPTIEFFDADGNVTSVASVNESDLTYDVRIGISNGKISEKAISIGYALDFSSSTARFDENDDGTSSNFPADFRKWGSSSTSIFSSTALDYTAPNTSASGTITILAGDASTVSAQTTLFTIPINVDGIDEFTEYLDIDIGTVSNASKGDNKSLRLSIEDHADDVPVKYSFATASAGLVPSSSGAENTSPTFQVVLLDPNDQTQLKESGKPITLTWTIALDGTNGDDTKDVSEAIDFTLPDFLGNTTYSKNIIISPRTGSSTSAPTSYTIGTSDIDINEADVTFESTEYFKLSLASSDANAAVGSTNGATDEHYFSITNIDSRPEIILTDSDAGVTLYEQSSQGAKAHDFQFEISNSGTQKSELPIHAYFKIASTASGADNDADISYSGTYEAGDLDYTYNDGPLLTNQIVTIPSPITASSTGSITLSVYDDILYELDETFVLEMYTFDAAQAAAASFRSVVGLTSESYATAPDGAKVDDTGYDNVVVTIKKDETDKPSVNFVDASNNPVSAVTFNEDTTGAKYTVKIKASSSSSEAIIIPYSIFLDYEGDKKTARVGLESDTYPYDYYVASSSEPNFAITGDRSSNTVTADGFVVIPASNALEQNTEVSFDITINNDNIYEYDEKITLKLGTTDNATLTNASLGSNVELILTLKNDGESKSSLAFSSTSGNDNESDVTKNLPIFLSKENGKDITFKYSINSTDNYPSEGDRFYNALYPNNENIATKGIDYNFGSSITTNIDGDSILTIAAGQTTANIPLTIINDSYDEYDQVLRVSISVLSALVDNDAAENDDDSVYTFTIIDDDAEPYIRFEANVVAAETNSGTLTKDIEISLVDEDSNPVESEKTITASYIYDVTETSGDYTSASINGNGSYNEYEDDFFFENSSLSFSGRTYSYNSATKVYEETAGQNLKTVSLSIYGDALYEVDEYVNIELTPSDFVQSRELTSGDHSFVYTIQDDDNSPTVTWLEPSKNIQEGDPNDANGEGNYQNTDIKVTLSKLSGTDILVQYSEKAGGTAESGTDANYDFYLGTDNTDLSAIGVNTKSVIIPAATSASSDLTLSIPIESWDDDIVEKTLTANYENFFLQIDGYRDRGPDKSWATVDDGLTSVSSDNVVEITIIDNDNPPSDFTVGSILTKTTNTDTIVASFWNPITPGYWNKYNTGLTVKVPIEDNSKLVSGTVRLIAKVDGFAYNNILTPAITIAESDLGDSITFNVSMQDFEGTEASPTAWFSDGNVVNISAVIADKDGNETQGSSSLTTITIDETAPFIAYYDLNTIASSGGTVVSNYWNSTNENFDVSLKVSAIDPSVSNGKIRILAGVGVDETSAVYEKLGSPVSILPSSNVVGGAVLASITKNEIEALKEFVENDSINVKGEIVDIAGNRTTLNISTTKTFIDTTAPQISSVRSVNTADDSNNDGLFGIDSIINLKLTFSESLTLTSGTATMGFNDPSIADLEIQQSSLQGVTTLTVPYTVQANDVSSKLTFTALNSVAGKFRDAAGNDMSVFTAVSGSSLEDLSTVEIDGLAPSGFTIDTLFVQGANTASGYWNSNSTSLIIPITNSKDQNGNEVAEGDPSLIGGKVQILGRVWNTSTDSPGAYVEVGASTILTDGVGGGAEPSGSWNEASGVLNYGQFPGKTLHFEIDAATMESALSVLANYPDESAANPEQNGKIDFAAIIIDKAGNPTQGTATSGSELIVDEVMPLDPEIGLPAVGYNYVIAPSIDNYIEIIPDTVVGAGFSRPGFYNSTNTGVQFKSWIAFDDPNGTITIDRDVSLVGGNVQVQMASTNDASTATWSNIGDSVVVQQANVDDGFITIVVSSASIESISGDFVEGKTLYFRNKITDKAGNITYQSTVSSKSLIIDETPHAYADLTYSRKYVNGVDHNPIVTIKFDPTDFAYDAPKITATYENNSVPPNPTTNALMTIGSDSSTFTYQLDVPGDRTTNIYDGVITLSITATDKAGNPIDVASVTNKEYLIVDNTRPTVRFEYENATYAIAQNENKGKSGQLIKVVALPSESMFLSPDSDNEVMKPTLSIDSLSLPITTNIFPALDGDYNNTALDGDSIKYSFTLPTKAEFEEEVFNLRLFISGTDLAGNPVDSSTGYTASTAFKFDNKAPVFDQFFFADSSFIRASTLGWYNSEDMSSANVKFKPVGASASPAILTEGDPISLTTDVFDELSRGAKGPSTINNNILLTAALADSNTYDIIFQGTDMVGNVGIDTIKHVTFDTKAPTAKVTYETEYITALSPKVGTIIKVTFNELQTVAPTMRLFYGGDSAQNKGSASWIVDDLTTYIDTSSSAKIDGPITLVDSTDDARTWYHVIDSTDVQPNSDEIIYDGFVWAELYSNDLAGNTLDSDSLISSDFENFLYYDNTEPTATITYKNLRDSLLTSYSSDGIESYCCFAIAGDTVLVKIEMNENVKYIPASPPTLSLEYNSDNAIQGDIDLNIEPFPVPSVDIKDTDEQTAMIFHYKIVIKDGMKNDGTLKITLNANDRSDTPVTNYGNSSQKSGIVDSRYSLEIDNIHPWGYDAYPIFSVAQPEVTFPTDTFKTTGFRVIENWINKATDNIYIDVPYQQPATDSTLLGENSGWGPQGKIDLQIRNIDLGTGQWQSFGTEDTIKSDASFTPIGDYTNMITLNRPIENLLSETMLNTGEGAFNRLQFRAVLKDKHGNVTFGQPSDAYAPDADNDNLYSADLSSADTIRYDIVSPSLGAYNDGNFAGAVGSKLISSDTITISWSEFTDPGGAAASGVDLYEMQAYVYPSTWIGGSPADTLNRIDSLFTVDLDLDGIDDPGYWYKIYKDDAPSFNNPITLNTLDSAVNDPVSNSNIIYDYNDTLKHELYYMIYVRAFDVAGNASDTIYTNAIQRYNSAPVFIDNIADLILYEDVAWDYDTVKVNDLDLSTLQNDSFTYFIEPKKLVSNLSGGFDTSAVLINPPIVNSLNGLVSWTPIQDSTLTLLGQDTIIDQSGEYLFTFYAEDAYGFRDTINYNATVNAVNDTPNVAILGSDRELSWAEDKPASEEIKINLSDYVSDIDNLDSELSWQFVIMDTSQLDEDFPLASVIIGPGTPKSVQTKLMKKYLGFDPSKGVDIPTLAKKSGNTTMRMLSAANSLITVDIDTTTDDNIYAVFNSDSNYHGSNHRVIFRVEDPFGAFDLDTVIVNILPENDPPVVAAIDTIVINENDSIWIDFSQFTSDVDDSTLTFKIEGIYNTDSVNFFSEPYISDGFGDTVLFDPFDLWSGSANFRLTASDEEAESSQLFTLNVLRVPRPDIEVSLVQNNAFSSYVSIIIVDKQQKTKYLQLEVQNQRIDIDTVGAHTYTGDFSFGIGGGYSFDVLAVAAVGKTIYTNTFNLAPARVANRWYANSPDGRFSIAGDPGSVDMDQNFLVLDSSLFTRNFTDQASYVLGNESYIFNKPIEINFGSVREDLAIYQRENGVIWKELPSLNRNGQILTFTENAGYFRLGPKTIIVPEETDLHQNYPNPFNPSTTIKYDIGLMDGLEQRVSVNVYNVVGQQVATLVNNVSQVGQFYVKWDGADKFGKSLPSGIYFIQLKTDSGIIKNKKMMFLK